MSKESKREVCSSYWSTMLLSIFQMPVELLAFSVKLLGERISTLRYHVALLCGPDSKRALYYHYKFVVVIVEGE